MKPWREKSRLTSQQWPVMSTPSPPSQPVTSLGPQVAEPPSWISGSTLMLGNFWLKMARPWGTAVVLKGFWPSPQVLQRRVTSRVLWP